ncbi:outer membrane protein, protease secretion system [Pollutimonas bauzanensis]|uniref:Outer membrane protein, protease secretion system n=2 Tax=Pollutimonas bauzanensis TaxID=658167 RepID=A0A1M5ZMY9_9BURK|nr:outer membrane protein, protease secretion system [Pollutimonas bauzanensis]
MMGRGKAVGVLQPLGKVVRQGLRKVCAVKHPVSIAVVALLLFADGIPHARAQTKSSEPASLRQQHQDAQLALAPALDLARAYELMLLNAPELQSARAARQAGLDAQNIARAGLLPQASINYLRNRTRQTEYLTQAARPPLLPEQHLTVKDEFYGRRAGITIEQPLFDYSAISTYRMGKTQSEHAEVQYRLQFQQVAVSMIDAYLNALLARETVELAQRQLGVYEDMLRSNERMMAQGEGTRIDILETRTQVGTTHTELLHDEDELADRLRELSALLGEPVQARQLMAIDLTHAQVPLQETDLSVLLGDALQQNPELQAARLAVLYNDLTIEREKGQFMPKVSVYVAHERIVSDTINNKGRDYKSNTIGLQVSIPLFSGGSSYYSVRQARNRLLQARHEVDRAVENTTTMLEKYYRVCVSSAPRVRTLRSNVDDSAGLVHAMRRSVAGGERTNTDALHSQRQAYQARQELLRTYVEWFQAYAKLQFYAGRFSEDDVLVLNRQLVAQVAP